MYHFKLPLKGPRLTLAALTAADLEAMQPFFSRVEELYYYLPTTLRPYNPQQLELLLADWNDGTTCVAFAVRDDDGTVGLINLDDLDFGNRRAEIGIALTQQAARGKGYAVEAVQILLQYAFEQLGMHRVWARVAEGNVASQALFRKLNFQVEGEFREHLYRSGSWLNMTLFGMLADEFKHSV